MEVVATTGQVAIYEDTVATSAPVILNGKCIIRIESIDGNKYQNGASAPDPALPYDGAPYTSNPQWIIVLVQNDRAIEKLEMGKITNHLGDWTNDLAGTIQAATDLSVAFQSAGGGGGVTSIDVTNDASSAGFKFTGGPVTTSGTITFKVNNKVQAQADLGLPRQYIVKLSNLTSDPPRVSETIKDTIGAAVTLSGKDGFYVLTSTGLFATGKVEVYATCCDAPTRSYSYGYRNDADSVTVYVSDNTDSLIAPENLQVTINLHPL